MAKTKISGPTVRCLECDGTGMVKGATVNAWVDRLSGYRLTCRWCGGTGRVLAVSSDGRCGHGLAIDDCAVCRPR